MWMPCLTRKILLSYSEIQSIKYASPAVGTDMTMPLKKGIFLIADPKLRDPNFSQTVVLLCEHNDQGSLGVVVNRPTTLRLSEAIPSIDGTRSTLDVIYSGGPVQPDHIMTLCRGEEQVPESEHVADGIYLGGSLTVLEDMLASLSSPNSIRAYVGYAGWSSNQLESELGESSWKLVPADQKFVFDMEPARVWSTLLASLGEEYSIYASMPPDPTMN
ncbi:MAG TPA: YqgE/AlgH family protein [Nitrospirales bacterium]|nr:YqgE/AlgH family protein [Nitrospirales bacterium]